MSKNPSTQKHHNKHKMEQFKMQKAKSEIESLAEAEEELKNIFKSKTPAQLKFNSNLEFTSSPVISGSSKFI